MAEPEKRAFGRNLADFEELNEAEQKLLTACSRGDTCSFGEKWPDRPTPQNTIRAGFLRFLILGGDAENPVHEHGVELEGAWIKGSLDLTGAASTGDVYLTECWFDAALSLYHARIKGTLSLAGSRVKTLAADRLTSEGGIFLRDGFKAEGEVRLLGAKIGSDLSCGNACFTAENGGSGDALNADGITVNGGVFLHNGFKAEGTVRLLGAKIGNNLTCANASFVAGKGGSGDALSADGITVNGGVFLSDGFKAEGEVRLMGAKIGGNLACTNASFAAGKDGTDALSADRIVVNGSVFLSDSFKAEGEVRLLGAKIGGNLDFIEASLAVGKDGTHALSADSIAVTGNVFLRNGFKAEGTVRLSGAKVGGDVDCSEASLCGAGAELNLEGMAVTGKFLFRNNNPPIGNILLAGAHVRMLADDKSSWGEGLDLHNFTYDAISAHCSNDAETRLAWLDKQRPKLSGTDRKGEAFTPQPWLRLKKTLREAGHNEQARQVGIALEERRRICGKVGRYDKLPRPLQRAHSAVVRGLHWAFGLFADYGYRPMKLLYWSFLFWLACAVFYTFAAYHAAFAPSSPILLNDPRLLAACSPAPPGLPPNPRHNWYFCSALPDEYTGFHPLIYSLNVLLPVVDLQQEQAWGPITPTPSKVWWPNVYALFTSWGGWGQLIVWAETLFGWAAGVMLIAVITGLTRKQEEE